jgi:hypothetical protein
MAISIFDVIKHKYDHCGCHRKILEILVANSDPPQKMSPGDI